METESIISYFKSLDSDSQKQLLGELTMVESKSSSKLLSINNEYLDNKLGNCPHCGSLKYSKDGHEKSGVQRYRCKICKRSFNPFSCTWLSKIHKKELLYPYINLMNQGLSLEKIRIELDINKKTAFDWRHKITSSLNKIEESSFNGITESDETFFMHSCKGSSKLERKAHKRGTKASSRGINKELVATIVTMDRDKNIDLKVASFGRITKKDIDAAIGDKINTKTILCTDGHVSYKGFAKDKNIEHHVLRADLKQFVKQKKYHIQHVNSAHSRLKKWIENKFHGVATKYLQDYLNWFRMNETFKNTEIIIGKFIDSALCSTGLLNYRNIESDYAKLLISQNF